jgi:hypothetical protein
VIRAVPCQDLGPIICLDRTAFNDSKAPASFSELTRCRRRRRRGLRV